MTCQHIYGIFFFLWGGSEVKEKWVRKVPELSLASYVAGAKKNQQDFVDALFSGLKEYGFVVLTEHSVEQQLIDQAYGLVREFFSLPLDKKMRYAGNTGGQRGYTAFKTEHAKNSSHPDLKEFWHVGRELPANSAYAGIYPENLWPAEIEGFKSAALSLYQGLDVVANTLLEALGQALDLPRDYFSKMVKDGNSILRMIHYPPTQYQDTASSIRSAAHEDINLITMLVGATDSGLELLDRDGTWLPVQSTPGQIVVDTGDMMARITNDLLPATTHRVVNPANEKSERFSMPFFIHPHSEAVLKCLPSCQGRGETLPPIKAHDFLMQRLREIGLY